MFAAIMMLGAAASAGDSLPTFMSGCWSLIEGEHWTEECWMEPKGGLMLGASREGSGDKLKSWEHMRISYDAAGKAVLSASPGGAPSVHFTARKLTSTTVEFVNASHDFPQRIAYELKGDALEAEISLADGKKAIRWVYQRQGQ